MSSNQSADFGSAESRQLFLLNAVQELMRGVTSRGQLIRNLRKNLLMMNQQEFAVFCKISRRTLTEIENDADGLNEGSLNRVLGIFGLQMGVVPISLYQVEKLFATQP